MLNRETRPSQQVQETRPAPRQIQFATHAGRQALIGWVRSQARELGRESVGEEIIQRFRAGEPVSLGMLPETVLPEMERMAALRDVGIVVLGGDVVDDESGEGDEDAE